MVNAESSGARNMPMRLSTRHPVPSEKRKTILNALRADREKHEATVMSRVTTLEAYDDNPRNSNDGGVMAPRPLSRGLKSQTSLISMVSKRAFTPNFGTVSTSVAKESYSFARTTRVKASCCPSRRCSRCRRLTTTVMRMHRPAALRA